MQGWQRDGWRGSWPVKYWFWRDRKGLFANPLGLLTNVLFVVGVVDLGRCVQQHRPWIFATSNAAVLWLCFVTLLIQCFRLTLRMICVARIYGLAFGLFVPLRALHGNLINCAASVRAGYSFLRAKVRRQPLVWLKTEHAYPGRNVVLTQKRDLPDVILAAGIVSEEKLSDINSQMPEGADWAEFLLSVQVLSEEQLCQALSLQSGLPVTHVDVEIINPRVTQTLPARVQEKFEIIPYSVEDGRLLIAGTRVPSPEVLEQLKTFCRLSIDFQLVTRRNYNELRSLISRAELVEAQ